MAKGTPESMEAIFSAARARKKKKAPENMDTPVLKQQEKKAGFPDYTPLKERGKQGLK